MRDGLRSTSTESATELVERERSIAQLCDDAERILDERAPHMVAHVKQIIARIRRAARVT